MGSGGTRVWYMIENGVLTVEGENFDDVMISLSPETLWVVVRGPVFVEVSGAGTRVRELPGAGT